MCGTDFEEGTVGCWDVVGRAVPPTTPQQPRFTRLGAPEAGAQLPSGPPGRPAAQLLLPGPGAVLRGPSAGSAPALAGPTPPSPVSGQGRGLRGLSPAP